jgi:hypothetical protein
MSTRPRRAERAAPRPSLRVVGGGAAPRRVLFPLAAAILVGVFAVAALQAYLGQEGFRAARIERQLEEAEERYALLRAQVAELSSPSVLEGRAAEAGMVPAPAPVYLPAQGSMPEISGEGPADYASKRFVSGAGDPR